MEYKAETKEGEIQDLSEGLSELELRVMNRSFKRKDIPSRKRGPSAGRAHCQFLLLTPSRLRVRASAAGVLTNM